LSNAGLINSEKKEQFVHYYLVKENLSASMNDFLVDFRSEGKPLKVESCSIAINQKHSQRNQNT